MFSKICVGSWIALSVLQNKLFFLVFLSALKLFKLFMKNCWTWLERSSKYLSFFFPLLPKTFWIHHVSLYFPPLMQSSNYARRKQEWPTYGAVCPIAHWNWISLGFLLKSYTHSSEHCRVSVIMDSSFALAKPNRIQNSYWFIWALNACRAYLDRAMSLFGECSTPSHRVYSHLQLLIDCFLSFVSE